MQTPKITPKAEQTGRKILDSALELFRLAGFRRQLATLGTVMPLMVSGI